MSEEKNVPNIRFKGFTDPWEQRKLGECLNVNSGKDYKSLKRGNIPVYGTGGYMCSVDQALSYNEDAIGIGRKGTINKPYILRAPFWTVDTLFYIVPKAKLNLFFVYLIFQKVNWKRKDESTGVPSLSKSIIKSVKELFPKGREQNEIAELFEILDTTIALHQQKVTQLKELKKLLMQKIFDQEWRFKGFTDPWEQRKLGEVVTSIIVGGDIDKSKILRNGKYPVYANALTDDGIVGYYDDQYRVKAPAVTVTGRGKIGIAKARNSNFTPVVRLLAINSSHNNYFLANLINTNKMFVESTGVPQLTAPQLSNYKMKFPNNLEEEIQIGVFFSQLDSLIALHQQKVDQLKELKKYLMQNLFV